MKTIKILDISNKKRLKFNFSLFRFYSYEHCSRAWAISSIMSSRCSIPTESRTNPGVTPAEICSSGFNCSCVVDEGWIAKVFASPMLAKWDTSFKDEINFCPASFPPFSSKVKTPPEPFEKYFWESSWYLLPFKEG